MLPPKCNLGWSRILITSVNTAMCKGEEWETQQSPGHRGSGIRDIIKATRSAFFCCVTNYCRLNDLNQHPFIISPFCRSEVPVGSAGSSVLGPTRLKSRCQLGWALTWRPWERIHFHAYSSWWKNFRISAYHSCLPWIRSWFCFLGETAMSHVHCSLWPFILYHLFWSTLVGIRELCLAFTTGFLLV